MERFYKIIIQSKVIVEDFYILIDTVNIQNPLFHYKFKGTASGFRFHRNMFINFDFHKNNILWLKNVVHKVKWNSFQVNL